MIDSAPLSVLDFGASPSASAAANAAALQAAITTAVDAAAPLYWPDGEFDVDATLVAAMDAATKSVLMIGSGKTIINSTAAGPIFEVTSADPATRGYFPQVRISGITFAGDGVNTTHGVKIYGAVYANSGLDNVFVYGATQYMAYLEQCWAFDVINCQFGFGSVSRTTSGTVGVRVTNGNAVMIRDCIITSMGLDYDGIGVSISSAEASSIENCTIENLSVGVEVTQASGPITIAQNYFENSAVVQGLRDITVPWIKIGTVGVVNEATIRENWFLIGNNARNVRFYQADRCVFSGNTHNPGFAAEGYYIIDAGCTNITIENNDRIPVIPSSIDAGQYASSVSIASNMDEDTFYIPAQSFISAAGAPSLALTNGVPAWLLDPAADESVSATVSIPTSWGKCKVKTWVLYGAGATGNVALSAVPVFVPSDGSTVVSTSISSRIAALSATINTVSDIDYVNWIADVEPLRGMVTALVQRTGTTVGDTLAADMAFYGVVVQRVPL
jgi:hypothetical protein